MQPMQLLPEILLFVGGLAVLITGSFQPRQRQWVTRIIAAAALVAAMVAAGIALPGPTQFPMNGAFTIDVATGVARIVAAFGTLVVLALASDGIAGSVRESETCALLLFSTTGTVVLSGANDLLVVAVAFLLASIPLYGLIGIAGTSEGAEASMKTYLLGSLFGIVLLGGIILLYGISATSSYPELAPRLGAAPTGAVAAGVVAVLAGLLFKAGGVPGHFWVPDAAQGAGGAVAAFLTTVPKIGAMIAIYRIVDLLPDTLAWPLLVAVLATASMTLGNLAAYWQKDPRRLLGWSTVSQVGYMLVPVSVAGMVDSALPALLLYLAGYTVTNLAAFAVTTAFPDRRTLDSYRGTGRLHPWLGAALVVALLGLVGTPPTAVFTGKLITTAAAWNGGLAWLAVVVFINSLISLFYYLRWISPVYGSAESIHASASGAVTPARWSAISSVILAALSVVMGVGAGLILAVLA